MRRYFTGINGKSFLDGFDEGNSVFNKNRVDGIKHPSMIYFVRDPVIFHIGGLHVMLKRKCSARRAVELSERHGGLPVILECFPDEKIISGYGGSHKDWCILDCPSVPVGQVYHVKRGLSFFGIEFAYQLREIEPEQAKGFSE